MNLLAESKRKASYGWCYTFIAPGLIIYLLFVLWPIIGSLYYSFFEWDGFGAWPEDYIGLRNYHEIFMDKYFWNAVGNTFKYVFFQNLFKLPLSLFIAYILNNPKLKSSNVYRAILFLPVVSNTAIIGIVLTFIFSPINGSFNEFLMALRLISVPVDWLGQTKSALWVIIFVETWHMAGQYIIYWLAGLQSIPQELYEAAKVDGANSWQTFTRVTIPVLIPTIIIVTLLGFVNSLKVFDIVMSMTGGGPAFATDVVTTFIYRNAFGSELTRIGYASAAAVLFGVLVMVFGTLQGIIVRKIRN